ncbi:MAG: ABC transporter permease [Flavobacteriales bacterium]
MNKIWLIIKREYLTKVKKKSFIVMTILGPIIFGVLLVGGILVASSDSTKHDVLIVDRAGWIIEDEVMLPDQEHVKRALFVDGDDVHYFFQKNAADVSAELNSKHYTIIVELDSNTYEDGKCLMSFKAAPSLSIQGDIRTNIEKSIEKWRVKKYGIDYKAYQAIKQSVSFGLVNIDKAEDGKDIYLRAGFGFALALTIYLFIFLYGVQVMRGVMEEKTNRIVEVIVSSVKPFELMMGKVIGIGLVGVTQFVIWMVLSGITGVVVMGTVGADLIGGQAMVEQMDGAMNTMPEQLALSQLKDNEMLSLYYSVPWFDIAMSFLFFFIGGYLLYGSLFAAIGAAVDQESDTQQFMLPITLPLIFGYFVSIMMIQNPEGSIGTIFSIVPLTSPIVMMVKTAIGVPLWLRLLSMGTLILAFVFFIWLAGRVYRVGILMYGKKPTYKELWKWIRYQG